MAILVILGRHFISRCPVRLTLAWALISLPGYSMFFRNNKFVGMLLTYCCFSVSIEMVVKWYLCGVFGVLGMLFLLQPLLNTKLRR